MEIGRALEVLVRHGGLRPALVSEETDRFQDVLVMSAKNTLWSLEKDWQDWQEKRGVREGDGEEEGLTD
jgi:hypothetical protein